MATSTLPISRLVNVSVNLTPQGAAQQNLNTLLLLGSSDVIDTVTRMRNYSTLDAIATDFGTTAPEYLAAALYFGQSPQPGNLLIGRWVETASSGQLICGTLSSSASQIATWNAITTGSFSITVDGGSAQTLSALDFSGDANLNAVASTINAHLTGATVTYDSANNRFVFTSDSSGSSSTVSFLSSTGSGSDISALLGGMAVSGAFLAPGLVAESALDAVTLFDQRFSQQFYGLVVLGIASSDAQTVAAYIEGANTKHMFGVTSQESAVLTTADTTSLPYLLNQAKYTRTIPQYSSSSPYAVVSAMARLINIDYTAANTTITLDYKQEPGIVPEALTETQIDALLAKGCNVFVAYNNNTAIINNGTVASGEFADVITGTDWLATAIQTGVYNLLYTTTTKIPQTDAGNQLIGTVIESVAAQGVNNGLLAPGQWNASGFGTLRQGDYLPKGYYLYTPPINSQSQADRSARKSVTFQLAAKLGGAVHSVDVIVNINQ